MTKEYRDICLSIWGCIPLDIDWAKSTKIYKDRYENIH